METCTKCMDKFDETHSVGGFEFWCKNCVDCIENINTFNYLNYLKDGEHGEQKRIAKTTGV